MSNKSCTGVGLTDRTITSLSGSSQKLMSQNLQRGALLIQNTGNANVGVFFAPLTADGTDGAGTAAIGGAGTYTLAAGAFFPMPIGWMPLGAIYVIGTAAQPLAAAESV